VGGNSLKWFGGLGLALALSMALGVTLNMQLPFGPIAVSYAAKQTCSCLFVSGRSLDSCMTDYAPEDRALIAIRPGEREVTASVLFGALRAKAKFEPGYGCAPAR